MGDDRPAVTAIRIRTDDERGRPVSVVEMNVNPRSLFRTGHGPGPGGAGTGPPAAAIGGSQVGDEPPPEPEVSVYTYGKAGRLEAVEHRTAEEWRRRQERDATGEDPPPVKFEHDPAAGVFRLTTADGAVEVFRDSPTRYLCVEPEPGTGAMRPVMKFGRPVYLWLCRAGAGGAVRPRTASPGSLLAARRRRDRRVRCRGGITAGTAEIALPSAGPGRSLAARG